MLILCLLTSRQTFLHLESKKNNVTCFFTYVICFKKDHIHQVTIFLLPCIVCSLEYVARGYINIKPFDLHASGGHIPL